MTCNSGRSPRMPTCSFDGDTSECTTDALSDDDGVFLGPRQPRELDIVARLSTASSPLTQIRRARKRDSREFLRRKTLMLSAEGKERRILRCLDVRLREESSESESEEDEAEPLSAQVASTPLKSQVHSDLSIQLAAFHLSTPRASSQDESDDAGSDKENIPKESQGHTAREATSAEIVVSIGHEAHDSDGSDEEIAQLDMGGLKLSDFDDPDLGPSAGLVSSPEDEHSDVSGDSPLPVARAGPVIIPVLSHHFTSIRAETGSPCRGIPAPPLPNLPTPEADEAVQLNTLRESPRAAGPAVAATPSRKAALPPQDLVERGKKLLKPTAQQKPSSKPDQSGQRALAIRGQLNSVLSTRTSALGPPQRSVSSSSSVSTASSSKSSAPQPSSTVVIASSRPAPTDARNKVSSSKTHFEKTKLPPRPANAKLATCMPRADIKKPEVKVVSTRLPLRPATIAQCTAPRPKAIPLVSSIPLKRPLPQPTAMPLRLPLAASVSRPILGQPSRLIREAIPSALPMVPVFSVGIGDGAVLNRPAYRSPAKPGILKRTTAGTPRRQLGTPSRALGTPRQTPQIIPLSFANNSCSASVPPIPAHDVSAVHESVSAGPPATATRHATDRQPTPPSLRGSSEDHEEVSVQLEKEPSSSPVNSPSHPSSKTKAIKPRRGKGPVSESKERKIATVSISEKELKNATQRNTMRNQVYHCAIDRQIIRKNEPRPPSPTSKIRTTADRDDEEKKASRGARAKRRTGEESPEKPVIEKLTKDRGPGDEEDFITPVRPAKRAKTEDEKYVKWDRGLTVIRDDGSIHPPSRDDSEKDLKSCLKDVKTPLDHLGNVVEATRPVENLKRTRIVVTAVFYQGEEPVPAPSTATRSKKK